MAHRGALVVVATLDPRQRGRLGFEHHVEHLEPGAHDEGQQALLELAGQLSDGHSDGVGQRDRRLVRCSARLLPGLLRCRATGVRAARRGLIVLLHDGPLLGWCLLTDARDLPSGRHQAGDRHLNSHAQRDNLPS